MSDKPDHLRAVPDLPPEEEQPLIREDGVIQGAPGPLPSSGEPAVGETILPMPPEEDGTPAAHEKQFEYSDDEEEASVRNHPSNLPEEDERQ